MTIAKDDTFIYPTDTVWGIGSSLYSEIGFESIADIKKTSKNKPLSVMFASVDEMIKSFHFPKEMTREWLGAFFKLETTLGYPVQAAKIKIPKWATGGSEYISLRCVDSEIIKKIYNDLQAPFYTTSLNLTGEPPITTLADALQFQKDHAANSHLIKDNGMPLSGSSSTIIFIKENLSYEIKREGLKIDEIKKHLLKLSSN